MDEKLSIKEIADWQLSKLPSEVSLPTIQRGFVWKPKQIEDLWDSILRGFPIGSFLLSRTNDSNYLLLDGQQRATAIAAGLYNPYERNNTGELWSIKGNLPTVWIDIDPTEVADRNKYLIRTTTRSHPWGYHRSDNSKTLSVSERNNAFRIFSENEPEIKRYTEFSNTKTFPFDSYYPIPLAFFFDADNSDSIIEMCNKHLPDNIQTMHAHFTNKSEFIEILKGKKKDNIQKILDLVNAVQMTRYNYEEISKQAMSEEEEQDEPTLFVRINSSGTALSGDDLIYSIYKSIYPQARSFIEDIAPSFISPTLNLSFAARIISSKLNDDSFPNKLKVKDFQRQIKNKLFMGELSKFIGSKQKSQYKQTIDEAITILESPIQGVKLPPILVKSLINKSPDLFLVLLYWLFKNNKEKLTDKDKISIVGTMTYFHWFAFDKKKLSNELWQYTTRRRFWHKPVKKESFKDLVCILLPPDIFEKYLLSTEKSEQLSFVSRPSQDLQYFYKSILSENNTQTMKDLYSKFYETLFFCKPMLLFAQRDYISLAFGEYNQYEDLEDTNAPWDWDHIYPESWVYYKKNVNENIRRLINSIGNFRALSLTQNRSESDHISPSVRLADKEVRDNSFVYEDWKYWQKIDDRIWDDKTKNYTTAIKLRMANIYREWWETLNIEDLQPQFSRSSKAN